MKKQSEYEKCTLHSVEYKTTSYYGNPSYYIYFTDSNGVFHSGYTASDASAGYTASNYRNEKNGIIIYLKYHVTKAGRTIIDYIRDNIPEAVPGNKIN